MVKDNVLYEKFYSFAIRVVKAYQYIVNEKRNMFFQSNCWEAEHPSEQMLPKPMEQFQKSISLQKFQLLTKSVLKQNIGYHY